MKHLANEVAKIYYSDSKDVELSIHKLSALFKNNPSLIEPFRGVNERAKDLFSSEGFELYPTVKKTTLVYDNASDCFFKILHPLTFKSRIFFAITDRSRAVYETSEYLFLNDVHIQRLEVYGVLKQGRRPIFGMKKASGESLYETLIVKGKSINKTESRTVIDEIVRLHSLGYWFGDSHLSHFFLKDGRVTGIIDIEGIRKNRPFALKNPAKDIAGLNHPDLPFTKDELRELLDYYMTAAGITQKKQFKKHLEYYTDRRWQE
jgi:hypothetical protein